MFDNFNVNLRKNEGFPTDIPCIPIPDYGQSNAPIDYLVTKASKRLCLTTSEKSVNTSDLLICLYRSSLWSMLEYAVQVWQNIPEYLCNSIEKIQLTADERPIHGNEKRSD